MSLEHYAIYLAKPGSKCDVVAAEILKERQAAHQVRLAFNKLHGGIGALSNDDAAGGLLFALGKPLPVGWKEELQSEKYIQAVPDLRTKEGKEHKKAMRALPKLPGANEFNQRIGGDLVFVGNNMRRCSYERIGKKLFVFSPWNHRSGDTAEFMDCTVEPDVLTRQSFHPEGCELVPLSTYYLAKEKAVTIAAAT